VCSKNGMDEDRGPRTGQERAGFFCARAAAMTDEDLLEELMTRGSDAHRALVEGAPYWDRETRRRVARLLTKVLAAGDMSLLDALELDKTAI
jgi:hypothetical protein